MTEQLLDGRYQIIRTLSSGGFGQTYLAQDTRIPGNPTCVVKKLQPLSTSPGQLAVARELFKREAETLARLGEHDQIPRLLAYVEQEFYIVQEYVDGHTLDAELQAGQRWSEQQVMQFLQDVLRVLVFVHDENVIHRDIKPANIIRRQRDGKLFLIDFGAIKEVRGQQTGQAATVMTGTMIGTIGYMPSEQALGKPRFSSDLFALGRIAIQAATGTRPDQLKEERGDVIWQPYAPQVSPELGQVLTKMTRYHHEDRYQSAAEALQSVQRLSTSSPSSAVNHTVPVTNVAASSRYELTLDWVEAGQTRRQMIFPDQPSKHPGTMRIGRDPAQCDIVLVDPSISGLHIEIFFNAQQQKFYVRNLRQNNPPLLDGQLLLGDRPLNSGSALRLGQTELRVSAIELRQYSTGQTPPVPSVQPQPINSQPVDATVQPGRSSNSDHLTAEEYAAKISGKSNSSNSPQSQLTPPAPPPKKFPVTLVLTLVASILFVGVPLLIVLPTFFNQASKAREAAAKQYAGVMTRAQLAQFIEKNAFASSLTDLNSSGLNIPLETENYRFRVASTSSDRTMVTGTARNEGLRSYVGLAWVGQNQNGESDFLAVICQSNQPTTGEPSMPTTNSCPNGFTSIETITPNNLEGAKSNSSSTPVVSSPQSDSPSQLKQQSSTQSQDDNGSLIACRERWDDTECKSSDDYYNPNEPSQQPPSQSSKPPGSIEAFCECIAADNQEVISAYNGRMSHDGTSCESYLNGTLRKATYSCRPQ